MAMAADSVPGFDPEDFFGLRRALAGLSEERRDEFLARWVEFGERTDCNLEAIRSEAQKAARACILEGADRMGAAWSTVAGAMDAYLEWRATRQSVGSIAS